MFKKTSTLVLVAFLALGIVSIGFAQGMNRPQRGQGGPGLGSMGATPVDRFDRIAKRLELTDEQQAALKDLHENLRKQTTDLRNQSELLSVELRQLWRADELDADKIRNRTALLSELRSDLQAISTNHRLEIAEILTKEQRAKLSRGREFMRGRRNGGNKGPRMSRGRRGGGQAMNRRGPGKDSRRDRGQQQGRRRGPGFGGPGAGGPGAGGPGFGGPGFDAPGPRGRGWQNAPIPEPEQVTPPEVQPQ